RAAASPDGRAGRHPGATTGRGPLLSRPRGRGAGAAHRPPRRLSTAGLGPAPARPAARPPPPGSPHPPARGRRPPRGPPPAAPAGSPSPIRSLALPPGAAQVAIGLGDGGVHVRRLPDGVPIAVLSGPASAAIDLAFGPEGQSLMALHADGSLRLCTPDPDRG